MPDDDEELFDHTVTPWTLGDLRKAVKDAEGLPDDFPVTVTPAEEPGGELAGDEQVIISAGPWGGREGGHRTTSRSAASSRPASTTGGTDDA